MLVDNLDYIIKPSANFKWYVHDDTHFRAQMNGLLWHNYTFHQDLLNEVHPDLAGALRAFFSERHKATNMSHLGSRDVANLIAYYKEPVVRFKDFLGYSRTFQGIRDLRQLSGEPARMCLSAWELLTLEVQFEGRVYTVVDSRQMLDVTVKNSELETCYPGWEQRYKTGKDLGVDWAELMAHTFSVSPIITVDLPVSGLTLE